MKKLLCIILAIVMMISFTACGKETPEKAADNALKAVKTLNIKGMEKYFGEVDVDDMDLDDFSAKEMKLVKKLLSKMSWEIIDSVEEETKATVTVDITSVDLAPIVKEIAGELMGDAFSSLFGDKTSEEEMEEKALKIFEEKLSEKDIKMTTATVELDMTLTETGWKIDVSSSLFGSFMGGLEDLLG